MSWLARLFATLILVVAPVQTVAQDALSRQVASRVGLTPAQARSLFARVDGLQGQINELSRLKRVSEKTLRAIALELGARSPNLSPEQFFRLIEARADEAGLAQKRIAELSATIVSLDPGGERSRAQAVLARARAAFEEGRLTDAEAAFGELAFLRSSELARAKRVWGEAVDLQAQTAFLRGDMEATDRILVAKSAAWAEQVEEALQERWKTELDRAAYWRDYGDRLGNNAALLRSIGLYRDEVLPLSPRERVPLQWAATQNELGNSLLALGRRETSTKRLEEAVATYRLVLKERTRDLAPLDWARTNSNIGVALAALGGRESGTSRLEDAVVAFRLALEELTRERVPLDWAFTQNNLGDALRMIGQRNSGTARLEEATAAFRLALEEQTRELMPLSWAMTQSNLGQALVLIGMRENRSSRLEEAVAAFRLALEERTRERTPLAWAMTQTGLGAALGTLGEKESGTVRLEEAATAFRLALEENSRERAPLEWARSTLALAAAKAQIALRTGDSEALHQARALIRDARVVVFESRNQPLVDYADQLLEKFR